jgi:type II secretory pathway component PulF
MSDGDLGPAGASGHDRRLAALAALVGCSVWLALFLVLSVIVPEFLVSYGWTNHPLPTTTRVLRDAVAFFRGQWMWCVAGWFVVTLIVVLAAGLSRSGRALRRSTGFAITSLLLEQLGACYVAYAMHAALAPVIKMAESG